ncbi:MAG: hypothetical protein U0798_01035 [Gemmataceae bacterium]
MKIRCNILAALCALATAGAAWASHPGELIVRDNAKLFTTEGIQAAKDAFAKQSFESTTKIQVVTHESMSSRRKAEFEKLTSKSEQDRYISEWTRNEAKADGAEGVYILISVKPSYIRVISDEQMRADRKFGEAKDARMQELLVEAFKASRELKGETANQGHDVGLLKAVEYAREQLKGTSAVTSKTDRTPVSKVRTERGGSGMGSLLGWVCILGVVLMGVWLVVGLIRAVTGMGGGGYGGGGYGGGYGGGGGGFMSSLLGGMFGSMAGMWMYNNFFGGGMSSMSAGDYGGSYDNGGYSGDTGGEAGNFDNGADAGGGGDWGGGGDAGGGDYGGGDFGGGDFGGGGGDFGGGGDW